MAIHIINPDWGYDNPLPCCIVDQNSDLLSPVPISLVAPYYSFVSATATPADSRHTLSSGAIAIIPFEDGKTAILSKIVVLHGSSSIESPADITLSGLVGGTIIIPTEQSISSQFPINLDFEGGLPASPSTDITASVPALLGGASSLLWLFYYQK